MYVPKRRIVVLGMWLDDITIGIRGLGEVERGKHARDGQPEVRVNQMCSYAFPVVETRRRSKLTYMFNDATMTHLRPNPKM